MDYEKDYVLGQLYKNKVNIIAPKSVEMDTMANGRIPSYLSYQNNNIVNVTDILKYFPISEYYIQFTDKSGNFLEARQPTNWYKKMYGIDTTWELMFNTDSVSFRTEGDLAGSGRSSGIQGDATRLDKSIFYAIAFGGYNEAVSYNKYDVVCELHPLDSITDTSSTKRHRLSRYNYNNSRVFPTANEFRMRNRLIRIYHLLSINGVNVSDIIGG